MARLTIMSRGGDKMTFEDDLFGRAGIPLRGKPSALSVQTVTPDQAKRVIATEEGQFGDVKAALIRPSDLTKSISAFANTDGGDLYVGIAETGVKKVRSWEGFRNQEAANGHLQIFEKLFPLGTDFQYQFLRTDEKDHRGLVLHVQVNKTRAIMMASNSLPYIRRGAQSLPVDTPEALKRLEYAKGLTKFEEETTNVAPALVTGSDVTADFIKRVVPTVKPADWLRKQALIRSNKPTVAGVLVFCDEPQAHLPKHCGIKVYRYKTSEAEGIREALDGIPQTIEGCLYKQIRAAVRRTTDEIESVQKMGDKGLENTKYPPETLHEIITNAVLHRDYSITDDVHIRIFDNRIEIESPGRLPAHVTVKNILDERFARNGAVVRILNKFPDPPNKDVGEGLNTAFNAMHKLGFKEPIIKEKENSVLVVIRHEQLASPQEAIMDYLERHETINNSRARQIAHVAQDYQMKAIFNQMVDAGMIEQVPGTRTSTTAYRKHDKRGKPAIG
jgi:ATP-dependent DNA helicase RecG